MNPYALVIIARERVTYLYQDYILSKKGLNTWSGSNTLRIYGMLIGMLIRAKLACAKLEREIL